jgi:hypothetical protein
MKGDAEGARQFDEFTCSCHIDPRVGIQNPEDKPVDCQLLRLADLVLDRFEFNCRVVKVSCAGTNEDMEGDRDLPSNVLDQGNAGGEALHGKIVAELNPVRASSLGGYC